MIFNLKLEVFWQMVTMGISKGTVQCPRNLRIMGLTFLISLKTLPLSNKRY